MKQIKTIFNQLKNVRMTEEEKSQMRITLISLSEKPILSSANKPTVEEYRTKRSPFSTWNFTHAFRTVGAGVFILLLASTGVSYAAEQTLPGDLLFPVKVNVNEEVRAAFIMSNEGKMDWQKERVVRRVVETETLLKTNQFTLKRKTEAETALKTQMATFATAAATTSVKDPNAVIAATAELEPALKVHQEVIANIASSTQFSATPHETANILDTVALGITATSQQETVAIDVAVDKNPNTLAALTDAKISGAMLAIDTSEPEKEEKKEAKNAADAKDTAAVSTMSLEVDPTTTGDTKIEDPEQANQTDNTTKDPASSEQNPTGATGDSKTDSKVETKAELKMTPTMFSAMTATTTTPATLDPKEILAGAKIKLQQAKVLREQGDYKAALVLAQDAYKDMVALKIQAKLAKKAAKDQTTPATETKTETKADTETKTEVKGTQTENTTTGTETKKEETSATVGTTIKTEVLPIIKR